MKKKVILSFPVDDPTGEIEFIDDGKLGFSVYRNELKGEKKDEKLFYINLVFFVNSLGERKLFEYLNNKLKIKTE